MYLSLLIIYFGLSVAKKDDDLVIPRPGEECEPTDKEEERKIMKERESYTSCEEFLNNTKLDIAKIVNIDWQVFYYWADVYKIVRPPHVINFKRPDATIVKRFHQALGPELKHRVNWATAVLFMDSNMDFSALMLATNQMGQYDLLPSLKLEGKFEDHDNYFMGLKTIDPHYLGVMNCRYRQLMLMAPVDKMPKDKEEEEIANQLKIRGFHGISYSVLKKKLKEATPNPSPNDIEDDREMDITYDDPKGGKQSKTDPYRSRFHIFQRLDGYNYKVEKMQ